MFVFRALSKSFKSAAALMAVLLVAALVSVVPVSAQSICSDTSPSNRFGSSVSRTISHPEFEAKGWQVALRTGPSEDCGSNIVWALDNLPVTELGTQYSEVRTGRCFGSLTTVRRWSVGVRPGSSATLAARVQAVPAAVAAADHRVPPSLVRAPSYGTSSPRAETSELAPTFRVERTPRFHRELRLSSRSARSTATDSFGVEIQPSTTTDG